MKQIRLLSILLTLHTTTSAFNPYGFQSGTFNIPTGASTTDAESVNDDSFAGGMYYDAQRNLLYFTGITYGRYFDGLDASYDGNNEEGSPHLANSDCILGVLKLPREVGPNLGGSGEGGAKLIYARRLGTPQNSEACSAINLLTQVEDGLVNQSENKLKLALLGHVNPTPLSSADLNGRALREETVQEFDKDYDLVATNNTNFSTRQLYNQNKGGFFSSLSKSDPITEKGRAYGFIADIDIELKLNDEEHDAANTALLGGFVLESSPLVYPVAMTQSLRDPNQIYVVSMHADDTVDGNEGALNPEYSATIQMESDASLRMRPDLTLGGAGGNGAELVGGVPKYGDEFYVKIQQLSVTSYEQLMSVQPTTSENIKTTMTSGWGFGFKLNDAKDVRPSCIEFIKGKTAEDDILLLAGTTRKDSTDGFIELDGFVTKLIPPTSSPTLDDTAADNTSTADIESKNPTKRIDSTSGRDETVTAICLPPPNPTTGVVTHAFIVGSIANSMSSSNPSGKDPSMAYILMMKLDDMSTIWKQRIPSIHAGIGGDVLGEGCAVSQDGSTVYLAGTIDGGAALNVGSKNNLSNPSDPNSATVKPVGGVSDVFAVAYDVVFGNIVWAKQFGTVHEDKLARGGGIAIDDQGNVIIMGSTRGNLQRYRPVEADRNSPGEQRLATDIFIMNLSQQDGSFIYAPYSASAIGNEFKKGNSLFTSVASSISAGGIVGVVITSVLIICVFVTYICRRGRRKMTSNPTERMWDRNYDDYSFNHAQSVGGRQGSRYSADGIRIIRGGVSDDAWDDGADRISKSASWMKAHTTSYSKKKSADNSNFLRSLRDEANMTMSKMFNESDTTDPRLDDGASIKSLLTHYREVRKGKLIGGDEGKKRTADGNGSNKSEVDFRSNPPPPPPRKDDVPRKTSLGEESTDGLAEFTIV